MKKVLLTLLALIVIVGALGAAGMVGYRYGFSQAISSSATDETPSVLRGFGLDPHRMSMHEFGFERNFGNGRGFDRGNGMMPGGMRGFGFFGPLMFIARIAFWALLIWGIYMLVTRSGWRLTRTTQPAQPVETQAAPAEPDAKE